MQRWMRDVVAFSIAVGCVLLLRWTPYEEPIIVLVPPLIIAAYLGGLRFSLIMTSVVVLGTADSLDNDTRDVIRLVSLAASGVLVGVLCDMLRHTKRRAERSERIYQESFHASPTPLVLTDVESGKVLDANEAYTELVGWSLDELRGLDATERNIASFEERQEVRAEIARAGSIRNAQVQLRRKDGTLRAGVLSAVVVEQDGVKRFLTTILDVTEQKDAERRFTELASTIDEVFWLTDVAKQHVFYISPAYERMWGRSCESLYLNARQWLDAVHPDDRERVTKNALGKPAPEIEYRIHRPNGEIRWIRNKTFPVHDADGKLVRMAGCATDITDRRKLELELQQAQKMESLGRLAGGVAHDFNNVLAVIATNASILGEALPASGDAHEMVEEIEHAVARATGLTRQLLAFSRKQHAEAIVLDVNATLNETRKMLRRMIGEDITLETSFEPELPFIKMDPGHLVQVVMNLAVNARDAMPAGGKLEIETRDVSDDKIMLVVRDTGTGMSADVRARIFEPFFTTKGATKGTGMGLAVVHGIVEQAGGTIEVESELGKGTAFSIFLPATDELPEARRGAAVAVLPRGFENVLVVDDDPHVREATTRALRASGYNARCASDGATALRMLAHEPIDLLLTDVVMPGMNGRELAETACKARPSLRVLYTSGYTDDEVVARGVMRGDVAMLDKPFRVDKLATKVREVLDAT